MFEKAVTEPNRSSRLERTGKGLSIWTVSKKKLSLFGWNMSKWEDIVSEHIRGGSRMTNICGGHLEFVEGSYLIWEWDGWIFQKAAVKGKL